MKAKPALCINEPVDLISWSSSVPAGDICCVSCRVYFSILYKEDITFSRADVIFLTNAVMSKNNNKKNPEQTKKPHLLYLLFQKRLLPVLIFLPALTPYEGQVYTTSHGDTLSGHRFLYCIDSLLWCVWCMWNRTWDCINSIFCWYGRYLNGAISPKPFNIGHFSLDVLKIRSL